jgi:hypothetical protein
MFGILLSVVVSPYKIRRDKYVVVKKNKYAVLRKCCSCVAEPRTVPAIFYTAVRNYSKTLRIEKAHNFISIVGT